MYINPVYLSPSYTQRVCSVVQLCPTLCDPVDCSPPGSSVHGILQARKQEWVAISFSTKNAKWFQFYSSRLLHNKSHPMFGGK